MHSTRQVIIETLNTIGRATVSELAGNVGVKAVTIRHHLNALQADGLVDVEEKRQSVGRPVHIYSLTEKAQGLFPQKYHVLVRRLLDQIKDQLPTRTVDVLIQSLAGDLADEVREDFESLPFEERMKRLIDVLAEEGFLAKWEQTDKGVQLIEYHCPYYHIGQEHPEICQIDKALIQAALNTSVVKEACILDGDHICSFLVQPIMPTHDNGHAARD
jgi:DeoR family suf operon transcriptional repressor